MIVCPGCGFEAPDDFAFCPKCATALTAPRAIPEERKVVTTLFCDLVGFTAMSETADPEDVDALLGNYFARATKVIESHGGTVEKFIGDAVVGVFGVPAVHEDDSERAVRAGLRILEALEGLTRPDGTPLQARCGVNTGEALVRIDVDPSSGRGFLTGDAVNVAARLEAAAPPGGVAVGALTHQLTERVITYEELPPIAAKGKSEPVTAWRAVSPVSRLDVDTLQALTPLTGRDTELAYLTALLEKSFAESTPQVVLLVGEPGIGKSRLVAELLRYVDGRPELVTWRQGRCPPYGEGATFWALGEIVKAQAGILETDGEQAAEVKLDAVLPDGPDREWFRQRLRPLLGLGAPSVDPAVNHTAWLRFFEELANARPTVLVFEDLHWADEALLAFIEHVGSHVDAVPLVIIGTARTQLFEKHAGFLATARHAQRVGIDPLSRDQTSLLVEGLVSEAGGHATAVAEIVRRADGNPFYAEESVRLLVDRADPSVLPASVQAVIAARLDALSSDQKALLSDAAVVGAVFWTGVVAALGESERQDAESTLHQLVEKQLVRRVRCSSMQGEDEYAFVHALARDVAYQALPRAMRASRHMAAATWLEEVAGDRVEDLADALAHHCTTAIDLWLASGDGELARSVTEQAIVYLTLAADRSLALDLDAAERHCARALLVAGEDDTLRPLLLFKWASVLYYLGTRDEEAVAALVEAIPGLLAQGDVRPAAVAMTLLAILLERRCEPAWDLYLEALALLDDDGPSPELVTVLTRAAYARWWLDRDKRHAVLGDLRRAVKIAADLGLPAPGEALSSLGMVRCSLGDIEGLDDSHQAVEAARAQGLGVEFAQILFWHAILVISIEGPEATLRVLDEARRFCDGRGMIAYSNWIHCATAEPLALLGAWDDALAVIVATTPTFDKLGDAIDLIQARSQQAMLACWRGDLEAADKLTAWMMERDTSALGLESYCLVPAAFARHLLGDSAGAAQLLSQVSIVHGFSPDARYAELLTEGMRIALSCGAYETAARLVEGLEPAVPIYEHILTAADAMLSAFRGEHQAAAARFADAAARWHDFGVPYEEAQALLGQGRCLVSCGSTLEAAAPLAAAREIFARLGAKPALEETDELMQRVPSA